MPANFSAKLNDLSIRNKLILMQVFTSVLVLSIVFTVFVVTDINGYKQRKIDSMISLAQVVGTNNISTLQFQDTDAATRNTSRAAQCVAGNNSGKYPGQKWKSFCYLFDDPVTAFIRTGF